MEPQYSILLYSKYSKVSQSLIQMIDNSGINFQAVLQLTPLCIDNEKVRERILSNRQIEIDYVPCILIIFPNGNVEKYDGQQAFMYINNIITQLKPPEPPQPPRPSTPPVEPEPVYESFEQEETEENMTVRKQIQERQQEFMDRENQMREARERMEQQREMKRGNQEPQKLKQDTYMGEPPGRPDPSRMIRKSSKKKSNRQVSSIENIPMTDDTKNMKVPKRMRRIRENDEEEFENYNEENDRHRTVQQPPRIRSDTGFIEDDELFQGDRPNNRREPNNVIRASSEMQRPVREPNNIQAKAEALMHGRKQIDSEISNPANRPMHTRGP